MSGEGFEDSWQKGRATGAAPLNYQWQRDGENIPGAVECALRSKKLALPLEFLLPQLHRLDWLLGAKNKPTDRA